MILQKFNSEAKALSQERRENEDESGILYDLHDRMRDIVSKYNDTIQGRCAVCLENFSGKDEENIEDEPEQGFTDRADLVRVGSCFHRFHLICVHRDWFMIRAKETDEFGVVLTYKVPEDKKCPICRRCVVEKEVDYVRA